MIIHTNNFESFENARKYACYVGVPPFASTSGTSIKGKPHVCSIGARMLKSDLSMAARSPEFTTHRLRNVLKEKLHKGKSLVLC